MKKRLTLFAFLLILANLSFTQIIYVDSVATGTNTGSSWTDAFTDLKAALNTAPAGSEIWVSKGTYKPDVPNGDPASTFLINKNLHLLGGFNGTETNANQRNPETNETILSGDLNGNDIDSTFANRSDNVMNVIRINANITNETLIDGFTIKGGQADGTQNNHQQRGGGIYSEGVPIIKNCALKQNYALKEGGAIYQKGQAGENLIMEKCRVEANRSNYGGGISIVASNFQLDSCDFINNSAVAGTLIEVRGGGMYSTDASGTLQACNFTGNTSMEYGGGLLAWNMVGHAGIAIELLDCIFQSNIAGIAGGGADLVPWGNNADFTVHGCQFLGNEAGQNGGGLIASSQETSSNASFMVDSCTFQQNQTLELSGSGLLIEMEGSNTIHSLANSIFTENKTAHFGAAAIYGAPGGSGNVEVSNCTYEKNTAVYSGGLDIGSLPGAGFFTYTISDCNFTENHASETCGGMDLYGESASKITVERCTLSDNSASISGGGILVSTNHPEFELLVNRCFFENNDSPLGAAVDAFNFTENPGMTFEAKVNFDNCLMTGNTGQGGTVRISNLGDLKLLNCTLAENPSGGIVQNENSSFTLQNTILFNPDGFEYNGGAANANVNSLGGNLVHDNSLNSHLSPTMDKQGIAPDFDGSYFPNSDGNLVNAGVNDNVTAMYDLAGNDRIQYDTVDIGAFESAFPTSDREVIIGVMELSPNPVGDFLHLHLLENTIRPSEISFFDAQGRLVRRQTFVAGQKVEVVHLPSGFYTLKLTDGERVYVGKFIKQ